MKVIDLLNKIANGDIPKKIKYDNRLYIFNEKKDNYYENETCSINWDYVSLHCLNEKVEMIEEEKKILEKLEICKITDDTISGLRKSINVLNEDIVSKINEIIDYLDYLKSKGE